MFDHPQVLEQGLVEHYPHPVVGGYRGMARPLDFGRTPGEKVAAAPTFGQHRDAINAALDAGDVEAAWAS